MIGSVEGFHQIDEGHMSGESMVSSGVQQGFQSESTLSASQIWCASELEFRSMLI